MSKILLIEDEAGIRRTLTVSLLQEGHDVEPCEDGLSGLEKVNDYSEWGQKFDAVILDINLPDINGLKVLRFLKEKHPEIPVIMITGYGDQAIEDEVKVKKGDAYLEKPLDMSKLDTYLHDLISRKDEILGTAKEQKPATAFSTYAFLRIGDPDLFLPIYQQLYFDSNVMFCDATRGRFDMVLLLHGETTAEVEKVAERIRTMPGVDELYTAAVEKPILSENLTRVISEMDRFLIQDSASRDYRTDISECNSSAHAFLEIEPEKFEKVYRQVYFMESVVSCDVLKGSFRLALLLKAPTSREIDDIVVNHLSRLDGVLRITHCPIITIIEM